MGNSINKLYNLSQLAIGDAEKCSRNPGIVEDIHMECRAALPQLNQGVKVIFNKCLSTNFMAAHIFNISPNVNQSYYKFGVNYVGNSIVKSQQNYPMLFGKIEKDGSMDSNIIHFLNDRTRLKFGAEYIGKRLESFHMGSDYFGDTSTTSLTVTNLNICNSEGVIYGQYLQTITTYLSLGSEMGWDWRKTYSENKKLFNVVSRYKTNNCIFSTTLGISGVFLSYISQVSPDLKIATEFQSDLHSIDKTFATIGYEVNLPKVQIIFRGSIDTRCNLSSSLEKTLDPIPLIFSISSNLNHYTGEFKLGCGFVIS